MYMYMYMYILYVHIHVHGGVPNDYWTGLTQPEKGSLSVPNNSLPSNVHVVIGHYHSCICQSLLAARVRQRNYTTNYGMCSFVKVMLHDSVMIYIHNKCFWVNTAPRALCTLYSLVSGLI